MKKLLIFILASVLMFSSFSAVYAADTEPDKIIFELGSLKVIDPDTSMDTPVTRGEFAMMVARLLGMGNIVLLGNVDCPFTDVPIDAPYSTSVLLLHRLGMINGISETSFAPDDAVTVNQAAKIMVICTGYEPLAMQYGGWPTGYLAAGTQNGLMDGVNAENEASRAEIYKILYNALDVKLLKTQLGTNDVVLTDETLRTNYLGVNNSDLYSLSGVVNANYFSYVSSPVADLKEDEVVIDSVIYKIGDTDAFNLVGHYVNFYAYEKDGKFILLSIAPDYEESVTKISAEDIISKTGESLKYYENNKEKRISISSGVKVVYNGIRVLYPTDAMWLGDIGTVTLIDHDGNGTIEVALIDRYESYIAASYKDGLFMFNEATLYNGKNSLYIDSDDSSKQFVVLDSDGKTVENFEGERAVSIFTDEANTRYRFIISDKRTEGVLSEINDSGWKIGDSTYALDNSVTLDGKTGKSYEVFLNFNDEIVFISERSENSYGYIVDTGVTGSFAAPQARILEAGKVDFGVDVNADDVDDTNQVPFLVAQNKGVNIVSFAQKTVIDGTAYKGDALTAAANALSGKAVKYSLNAAGELSAVTTLTNYAGSSNSGQELKYNVYEMVFGGKEEATVAGFAINSDTMVICVPNGTFSTDNALTRVKVDVANNDVGYKALGYEKDDITKRAKLLVMVSDMNASQVRPVNIDSSRTAIVSSVREAYDEETEEIKTVVEVLQDGELKTYDTVDIVSANSTLGTLGTGDIVNFIVNQNEKLENALRIRPASSFSADFRYLSATGGYEENFGLAESVFTDEVDSLNYIMITRLDINVDGVKYTYSIPQRNKPPVYIYYTNSKKVTSGSISDIIPGGDNVYILKKNGTNTIKSVVIVR